MKNRSMPDDNSRLVYSTEQPVQRKGNKLKKDTCQDLPPSQQKVIVRHDRKARRGKSVTVIEGIQLPRKEMQSLLKQLKSKLGTGGAIKNISDFWEQKPFIVINSDIITNIDLKKVYEFHLSHNISSLQI